MKKRLIMLLALVMLFAAFSCPALASEPWDLLNSDLSEDYTSAWKVSGGSFGGAVTQEDGYVSIVKGDDKTAQKFIDNLAIFSLLANVADVKSLVIHPASTTHSQLNEAELAEQGIKPNTIRLSIGIEDADDLIAALDAAFEAVK